MHEAPALVFCGATDLSFQTMFSELLSIYFVSYFYKCSAGSLDRDPDLNILTAIYRFDLIVTEFKYWN